MEGMETYVFVNVRDTMVGARGSDRVGFGGGRPDDSAARQRSYF
jgi:hypothetical protein